MSHTLIEVTLDSGSFSEAEEGQSFNNDSYDDELRNNFSEQIPFFIFRRRNLKEVPPDLLYPNVLSYNSIEICRSENNIIIGQYCEEGVVAPETYNICFNQLYNCTPLISRIIGDQEYISFLHTWAEYDDHDIVDRQVKHWMKTIESIGEIQETVFAPRKGARINNRCKDTEYRDAIDDIVKISKKTIVLKRNIPEIKGIANKDGVYFKGCGYHLWER